MSKKQQEKKQAIKKARQNIRELIYKYVTAETQEDQDAFAKMLHDIEFF